MTWLLVRMTPSARTMTPEPSDCSTRLRIGPVVPKNCWKNGLTACRTTRREYTFTTAGATFPTTGANDSCTCAGDCGTTRGWAESGTLEIAMNTATTEKMRILNPP